LFVVPAELYVVIVCSIKFFIFSLADEARWLDGEFSDFLDDVADLKFYYL